MKYRYLMPTKIFFGRNCVKQNAQVLGKFGKKALIVTGKTASKKNGSLHDMCAALDQQKIAYDIFDKVECNPSVENVRQGGEMAKRFGADFIIGIGGGSPMDAAKAVAVLAVNDVDDEALFSGDFKNRELPVIAVPTTAGTGSEVTPYSILTFHKIKNKKNLSTENLFPKVAFLDAAYTESLSHELTVNTALDALSHAVEGFLSIASTDMSDFLAIQSIKVIGGCLPFLSADKPLDFDIREKLLHASMLAGIVIAQTGTTLVHAMGYCLTYYKNIDHGRANAILMPEYLKYIATARQDAVDVIINSLNLKTFDDFKVLIDGLLGTKETLTPEEIGQYSEITMDTASTRKTDPVPKLEDIEAIYRSSLS